MARAMLSFRNKDFAHEENCDKKVTDSSKLLDKLSWPVFGAVGRLQTHRQHSGERVPILFLLLSALAILLSSTALRG